MVDQAPVAVNGRERSTAPRRVARNLAELFHDILTLSDLQLRLAKADAYGLLGDLVRPGFLFLGGLVLVLSCIPIALATIALALHEGARLSLAASFGFTLAGGLVVGGLTALAAVYWIRRRWRPFERSLVELNLNISWIRRS